MLEREAVYVALVSLVQLDDLQLREQQLGQRNGERVVVQAGGDGDRVAHRELTQENIQLAALRVVIEAKPARAADHVDPLVDSIAGLKEQVGRRAPIAPLRREIDVADRARQ